MDVLRAVFKGAIPDDILADALKQTNGDAQMAANILLSALKDSQSNGSADAEPEEDEEEVDPLERYPGSAVRLYGENKHTCGYCHGKDNTNVSYGMSAVKLSVSDYEALMDMGWRRSGKYCYKLSNGVTCCPTHTIRLDITKYCLSKEHRAVIKRAQYYFSTGEVVMKEKQTVAPVPAAAASGPSLTPVIELISNNSTLSANPAAKPELPHKSIVQSPHRSAVLLALRAALEASAAELSISSDITKIPIDASVNQASTREQRGDVSSPLPIKIASFLKRQNGSAEISKILIKHLASAEAKFEKVLAAPNGFLNFYFMSAPSLPASAPTAAPAYKQPEKKSRHDGKNKQHSASVAPAPKKAKEGQRKEPNAMLSEVIPISVQLKHKLQITVVRSRFTAESYELYKKYQTVIHKDKSEEHTEGGYRRFLVDSPLTAVSPTEAQAVRGFPGFGSFHQEYRIDNRLVCVGVIDLLPHSLSSVYLYYDPDFKFLSMGKLSALKEIEFIEKVLRPVLPELKYYYMGFYIHSCQKMRYKFKPSELTCPEEYTWHPYEEVKHKLDCAKYNRLNLTPRMEMTDVQREEAISRIPMYLRGEVVYLYELTESGKRKLRPMLHDFLKFAGPSLVARLTVGL